MLDSYQSTGTKLAAPLKTSTAGRKRGKVSAEKVFQKGNKESFEDTPRIIQEPPKDPRKERLYILIEDPSDTKTLTAIRKLADIYLGMQEVVLVLKDGETKKPLKMPFKVDASEELTKKLQELVGEDIVKLQ